MMFLIPHIRRGGRPGRCRVFPGLAGLLLLLAALVGLAGCARATAQKTRVAVAPVDPVNLQAQSLEVARQLRAQQPIAQTREYQIGPLDVLDIKVIGVTKYETTARVDGQGAIRFPDLGLLSVGGLSERRVEDLIYAQLRDKGLVNDPQVLVFVKELHAREVSIAGEVKNPGVYPLRGGEALIDLIAKAGGLLPTAGNVAYILRDNGPAGVAASPSLGDPLDSGEAAALAAAANLEIDLVGLVMRGEKLWNVSLELGDRVTIPALGWVHVTGAGVLKPGTYQLRMTSYMLRQVLDDAGGLKFTASPKIRILRPDSEGKQQIYTVDYNKIKSDPKSDVVVHGGDTVIVNTTPAKLVMYGVGWVIATIFRIDVITVYQAGNGA